MENIRIYLLSIVCAAIIAGILCRLFEDKGSTGTIVKLLAGLFVTFTMIRPFMEIQFDEIGGFMERYAISGSAFAEAGEEMSRESLRESIKQNSEAYILDKAQALHIDMEVEVTVSSDDIPIPVAVRLSGAVSPYAKQHLKNIIKENLGIDEEHQIWI